MNRNLSPEEFVGLPSEYRLDDEATGSATVTPFDDGYYVRNVRVEPRGEGHGTRLVENIERDADRAGAPLYLHASAARGFWEKQGFAEVSDPSPALAGPFEGVAPMRRDPATGRTS